MGVVIRRAGERGHMRRDWLDTWHSFSFGSWHDPERMGFGALRVWNDDTVAGGGGFPPHPHREMEIVTVVVQGAVVHKDSSGGSAVVKAGEVQRMTAGTGVVHSEGNASPSEPVHFFQIWVEPRTRGASPSHATRAFPTPAPGLFVPLVTADGSGGSLAWNADAALFRGRLDAGTSLSHELGRGRAFVFVVAGGLTMGEARLGARDAAEVEGEKVLRLGSDQGADVLLAELD